MPMSQRLLLIATSVLIIILIATSLSTAIEIRAPPPKMMQVFLAQAAKYGGQEAGMEALLNGTSLNRPDTLQTTSIKPSISRPTSLASFTQTPVPLTIGGNNHTQSPAPSATQHGKIPPNPQSTSSPAQGSKPPPLEPPVLAISYSHSSGPKHCRGSILQQTTFPRPLSTWKTGTCITLPSPARCGVFSAAKTDNCEALLFNEPDCRNTTETYVNTVVFMPEERAVGALWRSMWVRCGVEAKEVGMLDPSILGGLLKKPGGG